MSNKEQNIDPEERLLDALDDFRTTKEEWEELLSDSNNMRDIQLLQDCRRAFIYRESSLVGIPDVVWQNFLKKQKAKRKKFRQRFIGVAVGAACILLLCILLKLNVFVPNEQSAFFVAYSPDEISSEVVLSTSSGQQMILSSFSVDSLLGNVREDSSEECMLMYEQKSQNIEPEVHTLTTSSGGVYRLQLSDETQVWLNAGSCLVYPSFFTGEERVVELRGEAFFKVKHDSLRPFKVKAGNVVTEVLGTEFNVRSYLQKDLHVTLLQGSVKVSNECVEKQVIIQPGEDACLQCDGSFSVKQVDTDAYYLWTEGYFYFDNESLLEIMRELGRWYNVQIVFKNMDAMHLRLHFLAERNAPVENTLKLLNMMGDVNAIYEDNTIFIGSREK